MPSTKYAGTLTSKERTLRALRGEPVDRPPVTNPTNVATVELMDLVDAPFPNANRDPEMNARLAATGYTQLGFDAIAPYFSIIQESSALGCEMQWEGKDNWPTVRMTRPIWKTVDDIKMPDGFLEHPDNWTIIESIRILKQEFGDEVAIVGKTMGPWTLAYHVFGVEPFLLATVDDPPMVMDMLHRLKQFTIEFGLTREGGQMKALGSGRASSPTELPWSVSGKPILRPFDVMDILRTPYRIDIFQPVYFVIDDFEQLLALAETDLRPFIDEARRLGCSMSGSRRCRRRSSPLGGCRSGHRCPRSARPVRCCRR